MEEMDPVYRLKALIAKLVATLRADYARPAMTKDERTRYMLKLRQAQTKLAQLEGSGQTTSSVQRQGSQRRPPRPNRVSKDAELKGVQ